MKNYKALLFDLDNTLLDFSASESIALTSLYTNHFTCKTGHSFNKFRNEYHAINKRFWQQVEAEEIKPNDVNLLRFIKLLKRYNLSTDVKQIADSYENEMAHAASWYEGVEHAVIQLQKNYKLGILTNGVTHVQKIKFKNASLHGLFETLIISGEVKLAKPNKKIFDIALNDLGHEAKDVLMIGDSLQSDFQGAINAGLDFCWVSNKKGNFSRFKKSPEYIVQSVKELPELLETTVLA
jgi:2-haloacid dehalogenase